MAELEYECPTCQVIDKRDIKWISPTLFTNKPIMKITFWCTSCGISSMMTVKFIESSKSVKLIKIENSNILQEEIL